MFSDHYFVRYILRAKAEEHFPSKIQTSKTKQHQRIAGTRVFGVISPAYKPIKELARLQKHDDLYVQVLEAVGTSFTEGKRNFTRQSIEATGATIDVLDNIRLNEYDAIYGEGPSKNPGEIKLMIVFGDETFVAMIFGVCKSSNAEGKRELQEFFKSLYYDKTLKTDPLELANFEFDQSITNFQYAMNASNSFIYSAHGKKDLEDAFANMMQFQTLPQVTETKLSEFSNDLLWRYERNGITLENKNITKTIINNYPAYVLFTKIRYKDKDGIMYQVALAGTGSSLLFVGYAYQDVDDFASKFKKTAESIRLK